MLKKSFLFGSAAALAAVPMVSTGASAADLPVVEPVDYVRICDAFGAGFHYIPGTETCLKFSGYVRAEIGFQNDLDSDANDTTFMNSKFELVTNASSATEVGMVVGQFAIEGSNEGGVSLGDAWITIGENILVGRETSRFDFGGGYGMYDCVYCDEALNQFTLIVPFSNGMSFTLGLEDNRDRRVSLAQLNGTVTTTTTSTTVSVTGPGPTTFINVNTNINVLTNPLASYGGMEIPDIVASLRVSQGWGSAQVSAAAHHIRALGTGPAAGVEDDAWGFAVQAGAELNVGAASKVKLVGAYADGAMHYVGGGALDFTDSTNRVSTSGVPEAAFDAATGDIEETYEGWYVLAAAEHDFNEKLTGSLTGAYHEFDFDSAGDIDVWYVGATLSYEVVENLDVRLGGYYSEIDGNVTLPSNLSLGGYDADGENWQVKLRVQRSF